MSHTSDAMGVPYEQHEAARKTAIVVVGSGNEETVLHLERGLVVGQKHDVKRVELYGGSGVNYTLRLTSYDGTTVLPILSIGDDSIGRNIQRMVLQTMGERNAHPSAARFVGSKAFLCQGLSTPQSIILTSREQRTIFRQQVGGAERFGAFVERRLDEVEAFEGEAHNVGAVMVGHVNADRPGLAPGPGGEITKAVIDRYCNRALVFTNFGESQYGLGHAFWEDALQGITVFQLSIEEARTFFGGGARGDRAGGGSTWSLSEMLAWFQERQITAVITLDRFGAVATFQDSDGVLFAPAFDLAHFEDSTGAGDAFGAGLVHALCDAGCDITPAQFEDAIRQARMWAAYACTTQGGASECPTREELHRFAERLPDEGQGLDSVRCQTLSEWGTILRILDKAY